MSAHSQKAIRRHPDPTTYERRAFKVSHVTFELVDHPEHGATFALRAGDALSTRDRAALFTGYITRGMATELRRLAHAIDDIEDRGLHE